MCTSKNKDSDGGKVELSMMVLRYWWWRKKVTKVCAKTYGDSGEPINGVTG